MHCLGTAKPHQAGTTWAKQSFAKRELFSVLCIKNSCEPWWTGGCGSGFLTKLVIPRVLTSLDVPLLSCHVLLHISVKEWPDGFSFGNKMIVTAVSSVQRRSYDINLSPDLLGSPHAQKGGVGNMKPCSALSEETGKQMSFGC